MKSPYEILGVTEEQSQQEIEERYKELKAKYGEQRFAAGEEGFEGAKKLGEVEDAYKAIKLEWEKRRKEETYGSGFEAVEKYVKEDLYDDAQEVLNSIKEKTASGIIIKPSYIIKETGWTMRIPTSKRLSNANRTMPSLNLRSTR